MKTLTQYGSLAAKFWREFHPKMWAELSRTGKLETALKEAEERTVAEMDDLRRHFLSQGMNEEQAQQTAWEIVRERYVCLRQSEN